MKADLRRSHRRPATPRRLRVVVRPLIAPAPLLLALVIALPLPARAAVRATARLPGGGADRWGKGADERVVTDVVRDVRGFLDRVMPATPAEERR